MIKTVTFNNFKNKAGDQALTGFDMFVGENGVGKSAVIEAIELSLLGKVKSRENPREIFKLSRDEKVMSVKTAIELNGNSELITRTYSKKEKADGTKAFSQSLQTTLSEKTTIKDQEEEMTEVLGTLPISFDFNSFSALSNREKKDFILSFSSKRPVLTADEFTELTKRRLLDVAPADIDRTVLSKTLQTMVSEIIDMSSSQIRVLESLDIMVNDTKDKVSYFRKDLDRCLKSQQKLSDKRNDMGIAGTKIALDEKILEKKRETFTELSGKLVSLNHSMSQLTKEIAKKKAAMDEIDKLNASNGPDSVQIDSEIRTKQTLLINLEQAYKALEKDKDLTEKEIESLKNEVKKTRDEFTVVREDGIKLRSEIDNEIKLIGKVEATGGRCVINSSIPCHEDFGTWIDAKKSNILILNKDRDAKRKVFDELKNKLADLEKLYEEKHTKLRDLNAESNKNVSTANQLNRDINALMKQLESAMSFSKVKGEKLTTQMVVLNESIRNIDTFTEEVNSLRQIVSQEALDALKVDIKTLQDNLGKKQEVAILTEQIEESIKEYQASLMCFESYKYLQGALLVMKTSVFADLIKPVSDTINRNLADMDYKKFYGKMEEADFHFGLIGDLGEEIPFDALSTGQQAVLSISMVAAFIENSTAKLKVFAADNIECIDYANLEKVLKGLEKMRPRFSNIILAGCLTEIPMSGTFEVWNM